MDATEAAAKAEELLTGAVTALSTKLEAPKYGGVSTKGAKAELARAGRTRDETSAVIDTEKARYGAAVDAEKTALDAQARAESDLAMANQQKSQQEADKYKQIMTMFGLDENDPSSLIAQTAKRYKDSLPVAEEKLRKVQEMQSVGFLDNPLDWLYNQIQLPSVTSDYNREADYVNSLLSSVTAGLKVSQDQQSQALKALPTITTQQAKAQADAASAKAAKLKADADENLAKTNVTFATTKLSGDMSIANQTREMTALDLHNAQTAYSAQINAVQMTERHADRLLKAAGLLETIGQTKALDVLLQNYDRTVGNPVGSTNRYVFNKLSDEQQRNMAAIGAGKMGTDPFNALHNLRLAGGFGSQASPETQALFSWVSKEVAAAGDRANKDISTGKLTPEQKSVRIGEEVKKSVENAKALAFEPSSPFHEVEPAKMIAAGIIPSDSRLAKILEPLTQQTGSIDPKIIIQTILKEYKNPTEAGQVIANYYRENLKLVNSSMNIQLAGIKPLTQYMLPIPDKGMLYDSTDYYDITKPEEATKYILKHQLNEKLISGPFKSGPVFR